MLATGGKPPGDPFGTALFENRRFAGRISRTASQASQMTTWGSFGAIGVPKAVPLRSTVVDGVRPRPNQVPVREFLARR